MDFLSSKEQATDANSANGIFTLSEAAEKTALGSFPTGRYSTGRSLRFRRSAGGYLSRTPTTNGSGSTLTWAGWVKRGIIGGSDYNVLYSAGSGDGTVSALYFGTDDKLNWLSYNGSYQWQLISTAVFRDPSAWYHIVAVLDTTQAISTNRIKIYVNNVQITSFGTSTYPSQSYASPFYNQTSYAQFIGRWGTWNASHIYDGYLSDVYLIDGQALTPSSFGQTDAATNVWIPKRYTGTYGTNGFNLPFNVDTTFSADFLVVAGGGGGGSNRGGGGGAGGFRTSAGTSGANSSAETALTLSTGTTYTVTVGGGGGSATNGSNSVLGSITSTGGGRGEGASSGSGSTGGSGGGGSGDAGIGSAGTSAQGFSGGNGADTGSGRAAGGGGGASAVGSNAVGTVAGNGGNGLATTITGSSVTYSAGGGGGYLNNGTAGTAGSGGSSGLGGAGASGGSGGTGGSASSNTGSGGGGSAAVASGGSGGSGIVIIKIPSSRNAYFSSGVTSTLSTSVAGYKIYTVTATSTTSETVTFA